MYIDVLECDTKTPKFGYAVQRSYRALEQNQHTAVIQRIELDERITTDKVALACPLAGVPPIRPESASAMDIQKKILESTP